MKFALIFFAYINGQPELIGDLDGPNHFRHYRACFGHALKATPQLQSILRDHLGQSDIKVQWRCEKIR